MDINKEEVFKAFIDKKKLSVANVEPVVNTNKKKKRKKKKKAINNIVSNPKIENNKVETIPVNSIYDSEEFKTFKSEFIKNEIVSDFLESLSLYRTRKFNMFDDNDFFIYQKMVHPDSRVVIIDPSLSDVTLGKGGNIYMVKPMYSNEFNLFVKHVGDRASHQEEFITYCLLKCVIFPEKITEEEIEKMSAGKILALYQAISNISDFNKNFTVVEV